MAADTSSAPISFRDPLYASLDSSTESKLGLPDGLLSSIRLNGERSNADQVSSAGARTVYQITPSTRRLAIEKWGIDPYLSPQNASQVAGLLLQDSMQRNGNDPAAAVGEYHGGTDRSNWGPKTQAYVQRVTQGMQQQPGDQSQGTPTGQPPAPGQSTFDRVLAQQQAGEQAQSQLGAVYQAYKGGQMSPQEAQQYEADVRSGAMMLPRGGSLNSGAPGVGGATSGLGGAQPVPDGVMRAFARGDMTPQEMSDFENDVRAGAWKLPDGVDANALFGEPAKPKSVAERIASLPAAIKESITGDARSTPEIEAVKDWTQMPSLNMFDDRSVGFGKLLKMGVGTLFSGPEETAQILKANIPGLQVDHDDLGNLLFTDPADGKRYGYKPGLRWSDAPRAVGAVATFTPAGRATTILGAGVKAAATQAAIEGTQAATGGNFDPDQVLAAGALGAAVPGVSRVLSTVAAPVKTAVSRVLGRAESGIPESADVAAINPQPGAPAQKGPVEPVDPSIHVTPEGVALTPQQRAVQQAAAPVSPAATVQDVAQTAGRAAEGSKSATQALADQAAPSAKTMAAADRLGIGDYLQSDHVTTNDAYRQVLGVLKSNPTSALAQGEKEGLAQVAQRASNLIDEIGGTNDLSALDSGVKRNLQATQAQLETKANQLYSQLRDAIPANTEAPATNVLSFVEQRAKDLGGAQNLTPMEKQILSKLSPKGGADQEMLDALAPAARQQAIEQGAGAMKQPTYALLDDVRKDLGAAARQAGPFKDADTGLAKKLYSLLSDDQAAVVKQAGMQDTYDAARAAVATRKGIEDDLASLFGRNLDQSMVGQLGTAMKAASRGDASQITGLLKAVPDGMRQDVVASGLGTVFRNAATRGEMNFSSYAKWYEQLLRNKQAYSAVMSNLPGAARKQLSDLYRVSKGISDSMNARIKTGLRSSVLEEMKAPDTLASRLFDMAKHAGKGLAADAVGGHGAGVAMGVFSALRGGAKPSAIKAIDELLTSPEFMQLARNAGTTSQASAVRSLAFSKGFNKFARAVGNPREMSNRERWIANAMQSQNNFGGADNAARQ